MTRSSEYAFTLIELLITLSIVSIIVLTAIPHYKEFRARAFDFRAKSDLHTIALGEETHFLDHEAYLPCTDDGCAALPGVSRLSDGVTAAVEVGETDFLAVSSHQRGTGMVFQWDSALGGMVR